MKCAFIIAIVLIYIFVSYAVCIIQNTLYRYLYAFCIHGIELRECIGTVCVFAYTVVNIIKRFECYTSRLAQLSFYDDILGRVACTRACVCVCNIIYTRNQRSRHADFQRLQTIVSSQRVKYYEKVTVLFHAHTPANVFIQKIHTIRVRRNQEKRFCSLVCLSINVEKALSLLMVLSFLNSL